MTPHQSQLDFDSEIKKHIGPRRFTCLNSGSEAVSLALRIANAHPHPHPTVIALKGSFHGRTEGPARVSDSTRAFYAKTLSDHGRREEEGGEASATGEKGGKQRVRFVEPNDLKGLEEEFLEARREGQHVEAVILEPVMGEGRPALQIDAPFFEAASKLVREGGGLMIVDSVQAGGEGARSSVRDGLPGLRDAGRAGRRGGRNGSERGAVPCLSCCGREEGRGEVRGRDVR